jgi:hypothetical protein
MLLRKRPDWMLSINMSTTHPTLRGKSYETKLICLNVLRNLSLVYSSCELVVAALVQKCLGAPRAGTKQKATDIIMLYAQVGMAETTVVSINWGWLLGRRVLTKCNHLELGSFGTWRQTTETGSSNCDGTPRTFKVMRLRNVLGIVYWWFFVDNLEPKQSTQNPWWKS